MMKRYQYIGKGGKIAWTKWFEWNSSLMDKYQLKSSGLLNEYKEG